MLKQIRRFLTSVPFQPFTIHTSSGEAFRVEHPENAAVVRSWVLVALPDGDDAIMLSGLHITGVSGAETAVA